jgi:hypothetical protein
MDSPTKICKGKGVTKAERKPLGALRRYIAIIGDLPNNPDIMTRPTVTFPL